ncbi:MAG: phosphatidate cytidylyltransferase [Bacteriovoracaceae bacterium]|nr:phosphatidate cytidylyltransferase [Bacteriovoracaceae bacterium]
MSSNTVQRIVSAIVLLLAVFVCIYFGKKATMGFILFFGSLAVDEIFCNFFRKKRFSLNYFLSQALFIVPYVYFNFLDFSPGMHFAVVNAGLVLNVGLLIYLFYLPIESKAVEDLTSKMPFIAGPFLLLPMIALTNTLHYEKWRLLLAVLMVVNFGMDTGAWFFGKNFGKHKLWEKVSPKKTIEGLIGGMLTAGLLGTITWTLIFGETKVLLFGLFCLLGVLSQLGDLIQSKIKRQFKIKDSSSLIPGHGGVYDRIDSLLYSAPFFAVVLKYYY